MKNQFICYFSDNFSVQHRNFTKNCLVAFILYSVTLISSVNAETGAVKDYGYNFFEANTITPEIQTLTTDLFGDTIDPSSGSILFEHTDVSLPGNSGLPVDITRHLANPGAWYAETREFENWSLTLPHVRSTYITDRNGDAKNAYWAIGKACTSRLNSNADFNRWVGGTNFYGNKKSYWSGDTVSIPGHGSAKFTEVSGDPTFKRHNNRNWDVQCIVNPDGSDGFKITLDNGVIYTFSQQRLILANKEFNLSPVTLETEAECGISVDCDLNITDGEAPTAAKFPKYYIFMLATRIEDRFGHWVSYSYGANGKLTQISSNDGRTITVSYLGERISSVTAAGKTWSYAYDDAETNTLSTVTRPDNKQWSFGHDKTSLGSLWLIENLGEIYQNSYGSQCMSGGNFSYMDITHPEGMLGEFDLTLVCHGQSNVKKITRLRSTPNSADTYWIKKASNIFSLLSKKLTHTSGETDTWNYSYSENEGIYRYDTIEAKHRLSLNVSGVETAHLKSTTVINPDGSKLVQYFDRQFGRTEGNIKYSESYAIDGSLLQRNAFNYTDGIEHGSAQMVTYLGEGPFQVPVSWTDADILNGQSASRKQLTASRVTTVYPALGVADTYTTNYSGFDLYDVPQTTIESNNFNGKLRYSKNYYTHDLANHIFSLPTSATISSNGSSYTEVAKTTYHSATGGYKSLPNYHYEYGRWYKQNTSYHTTGDQAGLPNKVTYNGTNRWVYFSNFKRGKAQTIRTPQSLSTASQYAYLVVDDDGRVSKVTDFLGYCTNYGYNVIGRLTLIDPCDIRWSNTIIDYSVTANSEGLSYVSAGMFKQTVTRGNHQTVSYFDSLLRPRLVKEWDKTNALTSRYTRTDFDYANRPTYQSIASSSSTTLKGTVTSYDGLGRTLIIDDNTLSGAINYSYLTNNKISISDNKNNVTTTTYLSYGVPTQELATDIASPEGVNTNISYDLYGNITLIAQAGIVERRIYDSYHKLCKTIRPDIGNTATQYNALDQVIWTAQGSSVSSVWSCQGLSTLSNVTNIGFDNLGNVKTVNYSDNHSNRSFQYDKNNQLTQVTAGNVTTNYQYNSAGLLENEALLVDGKTLAVDYNYNSLGVLNDMGYPNGDTVLYAPNALGQPTEAKRDQNGSLYTYASSAKYYPNGSIDSFTYGNGLTHKTTLNAQNLPSNINDKQGINNVLKLAYSYDANLNITSVINQVNSAFSLTNLSYDGLDRLTSVSGNSGMGNSNIAYDTMGNITSYSSLNSSLAYTYDSNKRLTSVAGIGSRAVNYNFTNGYDDRGNVTNNGVRSFVYNKANQMITSGLNSYLYDGNNRRVKQTDSSGTSYSLYSQSGKLLYRESNADTQTLIGDAVNYIFLGNRLIAKDGVIASSSSSQQHYKPFGETVEEPKDDVGYTGHKFDKDIGLSYMQARYYDPAIGRFYSNDPVGYTTRNPVNSFNRYLYVNNNPYKYTDSDGEFLNFAIKFVADVALGAALNFAETGSLNLGAAVTDAAVGILNPAKTLQKIKRLAKVLKKVGKSCCFVAGTQVLTKDGYKNIEDVKLGEKLWAKNTETSEQEWKPVTKIFVDPDRGIFEIKLKGIDGFVQKIEATDDHPFYVIGHGWKITIDLKVGDQIETDGFDAMTVTSVIDQQRQDLTYNFTVADFHTYYVTKRNVLVHNCGNKAKRLKGGAKQVQSKNTPSSFEKKMESRGFSNKKTSDGKTQLTSEDGKTSFTVTESKSGGTTAYRNEGGKQTHKIRLKDEKL